MKSEVGRSLAWWLGLGLLSATLAFLYFNGSKSRSALPDKINATYDFVIVGGGTTGSVLASRLSESPDVTVLLLEAGGLDSDPDLRVPLLSALERKSEHDWKFMSTPQQHAFRSLSGKRGRYNMGRVLGGSSSINNMVYLRGGSTNYNEWERNGASGWGFRDVIPYFHKLEDFRIEKFQTSAYHSTKGPVVISDGSQHHPLLHDIYQKASETLGSKVTDCNGKDAIGFCSNPSLLDRSRRVSTSSAYLTHAMDRKNLHIATYCHVTKILISNGKALGVEYLQNGRREVVGATKEVVLSAGAIGSPHILLLSGVGPKAHLEEHKISVHSDLPVGNFIQDHVMFPIRGSINESLTVTYPRSTSVLAKLKYSLFGGGPLSSNGAIVGHSLVETKQNKTKQADSMLSFLATIPELWSAMDYGYDTHVKKELIPVRHGKPNSTEGITFLIKPLGIKSNGTMRIRSTNPFDPPDVDPRYLEHPEDVIGLIQGIRSYYKLMKTKAFARIQARPPYSPFTKCSKHKLNSDNYLECLVRHLAVPGSNLIGGCKMGSPKDNTTVVDHKLRVKGIERLRVVDSSVMPTLVSPDLLAPSIMMAEKAADMIRSSHLLKKKVLNTRKTR
ncbi:L-sorbose 1-dehydrogenase-like [Saccostrea echinata]|uniref:L-sorbose 1-dehydrogenase-like n=1 Tax=Saccostrea echinata TaxID=191078 RepID=UPI002A820944|nr:L-sorbose 1-dehydrogenase-like [Saccostrea echinata]